MGSFSYLISKLKEKITNSIERKGVDPGLWGNRAARREK